MPLHPPFQTLKKCPKCGSDKFKSKFRSSSHEFIQRACAECEYPFKEMAMDFKEPEEGKEDDNGKNKA